MCCENVQPWLGAWQEGEVSRWRHWRIAQHVQKCALCQAEVAALAQLETRLKIADPVTSYHQPITVPAPFRPGGLRYGILAATLVLVAITGLYTFRGQGSNGSNPRSVSRPSTVSPLAVQPQTASDVMPSLLPAVKNPMPVARVAQRPATISSREKHVSGRKRLLVASTRTRLRLPRRPVQYRRVPDVLPVRKKPDTSAIATVGTPLSKPQPEIIQISVKIADPQQVIQEYKEELAAVRFEAQPEYICVVATPEVLVPAAYATGEAPQSSVFIEFE